MSTRNFKLSAWTLLATVLCLTVAVNQAGAQDIFGRISGTVTDSTGAVVANAKITITDELTRIEYPFTADEHGFYVAPNIRAGTYTVSAEVAGFKKSIKTGNVLVAGGRLTVDLALTVGATTENVTVEALGEVVNTVSGELARTVDTQQVKDLALNTRNYMQLVSLVPGVVLTTDDQLGMSTNMAINNQTVNGNRADQNLIAVDGGFNMDSGSNGSQINNVGIDFVQEVAIKTSNFSAEYGRNAGATVNVVTKSGGNAFHGTAFEYLRNDIFDAINPAAKMLGVAPGTPTSKLKPPLRFNDFGWTLGGPIKRGKLFFFAGEEWKRVRQAAAPQVLTVPTSAELRGDFSDLLNPDPTKSLILYYPGSKNPIPGNNLANAGLKPSADGQAIGNVYKLMTGQASTFSDTPKSGNAVFQPNNPSNWREDIVRIDYHPTDKHSIYGRYIHDDLVLIAGFGTFSDGGTLPTVPTQRLRPGYSIQLGDVWTINSHLVNEAKVNASWSKQRIPPTGDTWKRSTYGFQFPLQFAGGRFPDSIPHVLFGNSYQQFTGVKVSDFPTATPSQFDSTYFSLLAPTTDIAPTDDFTWLAGHHTLKFGVLFARNRKDQNSRPDSPTGRITFDSSNAATTTGIPLADSLLGNFSTYVEQSADPVGHFRFNEFDAYVNDSWRVTSRLSMELGLRMEHTTPTYTQGNNMTNFDPSLYDPNDAVTVASNNTVSGGNPWNGLIRPGEVPSDQLVRVPFGNSPQVQSVPATAPRGFFQPETVFAPRLGFSWSPFNSQKTAIRGGVGMFFDKPEGNIIFGQPGVPPFLQVVTYTTANLSNPSAGTAAAPTVFGPSAVDPNMVVARTMQYSLGVQQELPFGILLETSYVGLQGRHEVRQPSIDTPTFATAIANPTLLYNQMRPYLGYSDVRQFRSDGNSNYNAMQFYATKRKGDLLITAGYTWAKALGTASGINDNPEPEDPFNRSFYYGELGSDRRQILVLTYTYMFPFFSHANGIGGAVLGGWELTGITRVQSGAYLTANNSVRLGSNTKNSGFSRRADYNGADVSAVSQTPLLWFNTTAFQPVPTTREGNAPVGNILGPSWQSWDWSLRKNFKLPREGMTLGFQADAFNLFNRANWQNPNTTVGSSMGRITSANPPRNVQFGLRLAF